jgi:Zn-dependent peptidase ImmA (M78 family)
MPSKHSNRGAKRAREAREALGIEPAPPLADLLTTVERTAGVPVMVRPMPDDVAGAYWHDGDRRLIHVNGTQVHVRQRFTLAHELGHVWCGHDGHVPVDTITTISGRPTNPIEIEANSFAAEFLVPRAGLEDVITTEPDLDVLVKVAAHYRVSAPMALIRFETCALVSEDRAARLREEIDEGHHLGRRDQLKLDVPGDRLARIRNLPYLSPALSGSALAAALGGGASVDQVSHAAGVREEHLAPAIEGLSAPKRR